MKKTDSIYLTDMESAIASIELYVRGVDYEVFVSDQMRHDATVRQLEILGEAANKLSGVFKEKNPTFPLRQVISMRNFLIHGYDEIELEIVWKTIQDNIPALKQALASRVEE